MFEKDLTDDVTAVIDYEYSEAEESIGAQVYDIVVLVEGKDIWHCLSDDEQCAIEENCFDHYERNKKRYADCFC